MVNTDQDIPKRVKILSAGKVHLRTEGHPVASIFRVVGEKWNGGKAKDKIEPIYFVKTVLGKVPPREVAASKHGSLRECGGTEQRQGSDTRSHVQLLD